MEQKKGSVSLKAGILDMLYIDGNLRYIRSAGTEILRMIYPALRDCEWLNIDGIRSNEKVETEADSFNITYNIRYSRDEIDLAAKVLIRGYRDNSLTFRFEAEALNTFLKNRAGLCVLHPAEECAGKPCTIIHPDGTNNELAFPYFINPHQPFSDISSMIWKTAGDNCRIDFHGDVFETEDQRNWTDDSYKTYSTPLSLPFPVKVTKGEKIIQEVKLSVSGNTGKINVPDTLNITVTGNETLTFPSTGICRPSGKGLLSQSGICDLKEVSFDHYRTELDLTKPGWMQVLTEAVAEAEMLNVPLELALFFDDNAIEQCTALTECLSELHTDILLFIIYHKFKPATPDELSDALIPLLKAVFPGVKVAAGTNANFAQLNRNRPSSVEADLLCWSLHPQEHASDSLTLIENLKAQSFTVETARSFSAGKGLWVSPVSITRRFNANLGFHSDVNTDTKTIRCDPRLKSMEGACWVAGSFKYLAESGVAGISMLETTGDTGILASEFHVAEAQPHGTDDTIKAPVYHFIRDLLQYKDFRIMPSKSTDRLSVDAIVLRKDTDMRVVLVNFTHEVKTVKICFGTRLEVTHVLSGRSANGTVESDDDENKVYEINKALHLKLRPFSITFMNGTTD